MSAFCCVSKKFFLKVYIIILLYDPFSHNEKRKKSRRSPLIKIKKQNLKKRQPILYYQMYIKAFLKKKLHKNLQKF